LILSIVFVYSCSDKQSEEDKLKIQTSYNDPSFVLGQTKSLLGKDTKVAFKGRFDRDSVIEVIGGTEIANNKEWGIRFYLLKLNEGNLSKTWNTDLLPGSFKNSLCNKIKFPSFGHELIYYNSKDFYLGSGGGEVFSYIINFTEKKTYSAHLVIDSGKPAALFVSPNIDVPEIRSFFVSIFKKDYPALTMISKDIQLQF
jgi:hypothetical protein